MQKHPNQYLNEFVARFALDYLQSLGFEQTGTHINTSTIKFLYRANIHCTTDPGQLSDLAHQAAIVQRRIVLDEKRINTSLRSARSEFPHLLPVISHGPQAWLINTYRPLLTNLLAVDLGHMEYGIGKGCYRIIQENVMASRMMFEPASQKIATKLTELFSDTKNLGIFEAGAGNGAATLTILKEFHRAGVFPDFLLSDIDPKTFNVADEYFRTNGFKSKHLPWMRVDIGNQRDLQTVGNEFSWHQQIVLVNFIAHEQESIAGKFFRSTSKSMPNANLVVSEFFLPDDETKVGPDFPWWFVYLHDISGQCLRTEKDFMDFPKKYNYKLFDRLDHQVYKGQPVVSTLFLRK